MKQKPAAFTEQILVFDESDRQRLLETLKLAENARLLYTNGGTKDGVHSGAASVIIGLGLDADAVLAALFLENCNGETPPENVQNTIGPAAALLAEGVRKISILPADGKTIREAQSIRNMIFAMTDDIRVLLVKLALQLNRMRLLDSAEGRDKGERMAAAQETLDIYAPLAGRLGISRVKDEMEDLSLKFLNYEAYQQIKALVAEKRDRRKFFLDRVSETVTREASAAGVAVEIKSRAKHFYSIYMKMRKRGVSANKIYDLSGIRIICGGIDNCYTLLGMVHRLWKPVPGTFKDYIARPKPNGYQSLHTSVIIGTEGEAGEPETEGRLLEIQIRTGEMHEVAETGVASHWLYKKGSSRDTVRAGEVGLVNRLKNWRQGEQGGREYSGEWLEEIKREILGNKMYVFTPQGKVIELAEGSTAIDFAYQIHTAVGEHCAGAKADGSIIPLSAQLKNTQVVEILTSQQAHPHLNWLQTAKTARARGKIRSWLEQNDESFAVEKKTAAAVIPSPPVPTEIHTIDENQIVQKVENRSSGILQVKVEDEKNLLVRFARCCNPLTGDDIIGFVSRGRGIIIHRKNCANIAHIPEFEERKIETEWENSGLAVVKRFKIEARFSANLFSEIEGAVRKRQGHLLEGRLEKTAANRLEGFFVMQLEQPEDLKIVLKNIRGIPGILGIQQIN